MKETLSLFCLALLCLPVANGADESSSEITLRIRSETGEPISGAAVVFYRWHPEGEGKEFLAAATSGKEGEVKRVLKLPAEYTPGIQVTLEREGFFPHTVRFLGVEGAHLIKEVEMERRRMTTLQFREVDGSPAAYRSFNSTISSYFSTAFTDKSGEFRIAYRLPERPWLISFRGERFWIDPLKEGVTKIQPKGLRYLGEHPDAGLMNFHHGLSDAKTIPVARLRGRLLREDGRPAVGWRIGSKITRGGGWMMSGAPGTIFYDFNYRKLEAVDDAGRFEVPSMHTDLLVVSPEGLPFVFPFNPPAWKSGSYEKETTITVPDIMHRKLELRWDSEEGLPAAGVQFVPQRMGHFFNEWGFAPAKTKTNDVQAYLGENAPPDLGRLSLPVSDKHGVISLPVHPWMEPRAFSWRRTAKPDRWQNVGVLNLEDSDTIILPKSNDVPVKVEARDRHVRPILCTFHDKEGEPVDPQQVRWKLYRAANMTSSGIGGFVEAEHGMFKLLETAWCDRVEFSYQKPKGGKPEIFFATFKEDQPITPPIAVRFAERSSTAVFGKVLDHAGEPEPGIHLHLTRITHDTNRKFLHLRAESDEEGKFLFPFAPPECGFHVTAHWDGQSLSLNHLIEYPKVTPRNREIAIKMKPTGSLRVKLIGAKSLPRYISLNPEGDDPGGPLRRCVRLHPSRSDASVFYAPHIAPGKYRLTYNHNQIVEPLGDKPVVIPPDVETELPVAASAAMARGESALPKPKALIRVKVTREGVAVPGAVVRMDEIAVERGSGSMRHFSAYRGDTTGREGDAWFMADPNSTMFFAAMDHDRNIAWKEVLILGLKVEVSLELKPFKEAVPKLPPATYSELRGKSGVNLASLMLGLYRQDMSFVRKVKKERAE